MKILFFCTAHNSLSQRLYLVLSRQHSVTVEYALSAKSMIEAADLVQPDLIICPFLTSLVPRQVYEAYLTLIVHPGPPGDAGPSAIDWLLMGDDGTEPDSQLLLDDMENRLNPLGRSHWGVTVLQATEEFDAGPVWAFDQFAVNINDTSVTKSSLYRGPVTRAAIAATLAAVERIQTAATLESAVLGAPASPPSTPTRDGTHGKNGEAGAGRRIVPGLSAHAEFAKLSVTVSQPFLGGTTRHRPLLKAAQRDFDVKRHVASTISRFIRSADSQPGCLSDLFGRKLYLYGGMIENPTLLSCTGQFVPPGSIVAVRDEAVCIATCDNRGVWITHIRQVKTKTDVALWPKVPAASGLRQLGLMPAGEGACGFDFLLPQAASDQWAKSYHSTFQDIWVDFVSDGQRRLAYLYFDLYNGAMSTAQCRRMVQCLDYVLDTASDPNESLPLAAVVLMGGDSYFSNGIHLNVIEAAADPALESWYNINAINDVVQKMLLDFPAQGVTTVAAIRGNAAAGGVALATACDLVVAAPEVVLNPAYRALGLHGSEFHSISYPGRCGAYGARMALRSMTPLSAHDARDMGLVDHVLPQQQYQHEFSAQVLDASVRRYVEQQISSPSLHQQHHLVDSRASPSASSGRIGAWKQNVDTSSAALALARATELGQMSMDFWSARSERYHARRSDFVRKAKPSSTPLRFATHRREQGMLDEEEQDEFDSVEWFVSKSKRNLKKDMSDKMIRLIHDFRNACDLRDEKPAGALNSNSAKLLSPLRRDANMPLTPSTPIFSCYYGA
ncbi:hypothetical protein E4U42_001214 [Claviceps africana]|uniref:Formyl transferase C-terminal domain-containing protein n=1 Tax=Claviceps africana TaxID=83212 RepID=A0A8K0NEI3_9HYPO|nr:hypothetical protein E4U42_001214 [Claviceps africana]